MAIAFPVYDVLRYFHSTVLWRWFHQGASTSGRDNLSQMIQASLGVIGCFQEIGLPQAKMDGL